MNQPVWREPGDPLLERAIREIGNLAERTSRIRFRPGVYRYRTVDEMNAAAERIRVKR